MSFAVMFRIKISSVGVEEVAGIKRDAVVAQLFQFCRFLPLTPLLLVQILAFGQEGMS